MKRKILFSKTRGCIFCFVLFIEGGVCVCFFGTPCVRVVVCSVEITVGAVDRVNADTGKTDRQILWLRCSRLLVHVEPSVGCLRVELGSRTVRSRGTCEPLY